MYYAEFGKFNIPPVKDETLKRLHGMTFGIPRIDYDVYKCTPTPGQLCFADSLEAKARARHRLESGLSESRKLGVRRQARWLTALGRQRLCR